MYIRVEKRPMKRKSLGSMKKLEPYISSWTINGVLYESAGFRRVDRFERPLKDIYKFTLCHSYRENRKSKKRQFVLFSTDYYWFTDSFFCLWDYIGIEREDSERYKKFEEFRKALGLSFDDLYDYIETEIEKVRKPLIKEYHRTEEYKTDKKNDDIIKSYYEAKGKFDEKYGKDTYEKCYNVFQELWNKKKLEEIKELYRLKQEYSKQRSNSYSNNNYNNYSSFYSSTPSYTDKEKEMLKTIYKRMAAVFHPDNKHGDEEIMKFINSKLKDDWNL